jgi:hypothetical protein
LLDWRIDVLSVGGEIGIFECLVVTGEVETTWKCC